MGKKKIHFLGGSTVLKTKGHLHKSKRAVKGGVGYFSGQALGNPAEFVGKTYGIKKQDVVVADKPKSKFSKKVRKQIDAARGKNIKSYKGDETLVPKKVLVSEITIKAVGSSSFVLERKQKKRV